ncbi:MAG: hypothetical protein RMJ46_04930 [Bacteroidota bacterium]|nr:hypothetical protein [Bacteroidota bacterium]
MRPVVIVLFVLGVPATLFIAQHFATLPELTFAQAVVLAEQQPGEERAQKVMLRGTVHALPPPGRVTPTFWMQDTEGTIFAVEYTGGEALPVLQPGESIVVFGHAHGGASPYFHASEVRRE